MSYATALSPQRMHPDAVRIAALSAAIALNLGMLLAALRPLATNLIKPAPIPTPTVIFHQDPAPPPPQPAPPELIPLPHATPTAIPQPPAAVEPSHFVTPAPVVTPVPAVAPATHLTPPQPAAAIDNTPHEATLAYLNAPAPTYPMQARHMNMQGTVVLRVLVDASGHPRQVQVQSSSGYPLLDRTARMQVLRHWLFQPAMVDGHAASAWARVPIHFNLRNL